MHDRQNTDKKPRFNRRAVVRFSYKNGLFACAGAAAVALLRNHDVLDSSVRAWFGAAGASAVLLLMLNGLDQGTNEEPRQTVDEPRQTVPISLADSVLARILITSSVALGTWFVSGRSSPDVVVDTSVGFALFELADDLIGYLYDRMSAPEESASSPRMAA